MILVDPDGHTVTFKQDKNTTNEDFAKMKQIYETVKNSTNADGTKTEVAKMADELEASQQVAVVITVLPEPVPVPRRVATATPTDPGNASVSGKGSGTNINISPNTTGFENNPIANDPETTMAHELVHAYDNMSGNNRGHQLDEIHAGDVTNQFADSKGKNQRAYSGSSSLQQYKNGKAVDMFGSPILLPDEK